MHARTHACTCGAALHRAAENGSDGAVKLLLARGAEINARMHGDRTALHVAAASVHRNMCVRVHTCNVGACGRFALDHYYLSFMIIMIIVIIIIILILIIIITVRVMLEHAVGLSLEHALNMN